MSDEEEMKQPKGIPFIAVTDAARAAILAVQESYEEYLPEIDNSEYYRRATEAALRAALMAVGEL